MATLRLAIVGSGAVNFGGAEGPWNHSKRLEMLGGVEIVAIADPLTEKAKSILEEKLQGEHKDLYKKCVVLASFKDILKFEDDRKPHAVFIGTYSLQYPVQHVRTYLVILIIECNHTCWISWYCSM